MITQYGIAKITSTIGEMCDRVRYKLNGEVAYTAIQRKVVNEDNIKLYIQFDDTIIGTISEITVIDTESNVIISSEKEYVKTTDKAFWVTFKYKVSEAVWEE